MRTGGCIINLSRKNNRTQPFQETKKDNRTYQQRVKPLLFFGQIIIEFNVFS